MRTKYPDCGLTLLGDFNRTDISEICRGDLLSQVVKNNTRGDAILDLILTNMKDWYQCPSILPPIGMSDHSSVLWVPKAKTTDNKPIKKQTRQLGESGLFEFGKWITKHKWSEVYDAHGVIDKANAFHSTLENAINTFFPTKIIKVHQTDKPWVTQQIKRLISLRQKAFHRQSANVWKFYRNLTQRALARAKKFYYTDRVASLKTANPKQWHQEIMNMANVRKPDSNISVPGIATEDNSSIANAINTKFAQVSQALPALDLTQLPAFLPAPHQLPSLAVWDVYKRLQAVKTNKAPGPDNTPLKLLKEFACELSSPFCHILNTSFSNGIVPDQWKQAVVVPVAKTQPASIDQLRPISLTSPFAKIAEHFALSWILQDVKFDNRQFGSLKGRSTVHALVSLVDSLFQGTDKPSTICTLVATDFTKAFDRVHHHTVITKLLNMGLRPELVPWLANFISDRKQRVRYRGSFSEWEYLSCGVAQGTLLSPVLFLVLIDDAASDTVTPVWKYVDDMNMLQTSRLQQPSTLQSDLDQLYQWSNRNHMLLNGSKCLAMHITFCRKLPPLPLLQINNTPLNVATSLKILGLHIQNNLHWDSQVKQMVGRASKKLFLLKRLRRCNLSHKDLISIYTGYIRPILEYAVPVWSSGLTKAQIVKLERVQKRACRIVLGNDYTGYANALQHLGLTSLVDRREQLCLKFARTLMESTFRDWLPRSRGEISGRNTRNKQKLNTPLCRTNRLKNSPIPYLVNLLNKGQ
ncbi:hypothetical protein Bbelb_192050 [Branchiostoma belcheri]|nr:hypothetical protein Bbelb_192050 [Branchiostoma belcheri]